MNFTEKSYRSLNSLGFHNIVYSDWVPQNTDNKERIIIGVHGITCNGSDFDILAEALCDRGYRFIAVDLPGRGRSDFLPNPMDYNPIQYSRDIAALLAHLDIDQNQTIDWLGVSLGGLIGIALAGVQNSPISRMIINDVGPVVPQAAMEYIKDVVFEPRYFDTIKHLEDDLRTNQRSQWGPLTDEQWHHMAEQNARALDDGSLTYAYDPDIRIPFAKALKTGGGDLWPYWDNIKCPVMVLRGGYSKILPLEIVQDMQNRGPGENMHLVQFDDCGHVPSMWAPGHIEAITQWLNSAPTS